MTRIEFPEKDKDKLAPGMLADFTVLDRDLTAVPPEEILGTQVLRTVVGGTRQRLCIQPIVFLATLSDVPACHCIIEKHHCWR